MNSVNLRAKALLLVIVALFGSSSMVLAEFSMDKTLEENAQVGLDYAKAAYQRGEAWAKPHLENLCKDVQARTSRVRNSTLSQLSEDLRAFFNNPKNTFGAGIIVGTVGGIWLFKKYKRRQARLALQARAQDQLDEVEAASY